MSFYVRVFWLAGWCRLWSGISSSIPNMWHGNQHSWPLFSGTHQHVCCHNSPVQFPLLPAMTSFSSQRVLGVPSSCSPNTYQSFLLVLFPFPQSLRSRPRFFFSSWSFLSHPIPVSMIPSHSLVTEWGEGGVCKRGLEGEASRGMLTNTRQHVQWIRYC